MPHYLSRSLQLVCPRGQGRAISKSLAGGAPVMLGFSGVIRPGRLLWLRATAWLIFSIFAVAVAFGMSSDAVSKLAADSGDPTAFAARCAGPIIALSAYGLLVRMGEARAPVEIGLKSALPHLAVA